MQCTPQATYTMLTVPCAECCMPPGPDFEAAGLLLSSAQLFASSALSHCKHDMDTFFVVKCENSRKSAHLLFGRLVKCSAMGVLSRHLQ